MAPFSISIDTRGLVDLAASWPRLYGFITLPPVGLGEGSLAPWILWAIWTARNNLIFNNKGTSPEETITKALTITTRKHNFNDEN